VSDSPRLVRSRAICWPMATSTCILLLRVIPHDDIET
jgi:hypothetical protein